MSVLHYEGGKIRQKAIINNSNFIFKERKTKMRKIFKSFLTLLVATAIFVSGIVAVSASGGSSQIVPRWNVAQQNNFTFIVSDTNKATVRVTYTADSATFQKANLTVKIEKRFLLVFWNEVDIGYTNNEWKASSTSPTGNFYNVFTVNGKGTYRAKITLEIIGNNGQKDVIEETLEYEYK